MWKSRLLGSARECFPMSSVRRVHFAVITCGYVYGVRAACGSHTLCSVSVCARVCARYLRAWKMDCFAFAARTGMDCMNRILWSVGACSCLLCREAVGRGCDNGARVNDKRGCWDSFTDYDIRFRQMFGLKLTCVMRIRSESRRMEWRMPLDFRIQCFALARRHMQINAALMD